MNHRNIYIIVNNICCEYVEECMEGQKLTKEQEKNRSFCLNKPYSHDLTRNHQNNSGGIRGYARRKNTRIENN